VRTFEVTQEAEDGWVAMHEQYAAFISGIWADCTPSYFNNEGKASLAVTRNGGFGGGVPAFIDILAQWRDAGNLEGLRVERASEAAPVEASSAV
jgi:cyclohexanone monooxygenase